MISIIIPIYNVEQYLQRCIDSVLAQTYTDLEIILVDDGSPDGCGKICDAYAEKDSRIKVIHQENRGVSCARNAGLEIATGDQIAFLDSDDYVDATMYQQLLTVMEKTDADIAECGYRWVKPHETYDNENTGKIDIYTNLEALDKLYFGDQMFGGLSIVVWNKLYRRSLLTDLRFAPGLNFEDVDFTPRVLYRAKKIAKLNLNLYNFFFSPNSISRGCFTLKKLDAITARQRILSFFREEKLDKYFNFVESTYFSTLYDGWYHCRKGRRETAYRVKEEQLLRQLCDEYNNILKNPHERHNLWRHRLFHFSPMIYYLFLDIKRKLVNK